MKCKHCKKPIERIVDTQGYVEHFGLEYGYVHSEPYASGEKASLCEGGGSFAEPEL